MFSPGHRFGTFSEYRRYRFLPLTDDLVWAGGHQPHGMARKRAAVMRRCFRALARLHAVRGLTRLA